MLDRRRFLTGLITGAAALAVCPEELLAAPRKSYFFLSDPGLVVDHYNRMACSILMNSFSWSDATHRTYRGEELFA